METIDPGPGAPTARPTQPVTIGLIRLEPTPGAVKRARNYVGGLLALHGWDEDKIEQARVVVSELATNAVRHAGTAWELRCTIDGVAHIEVIDAAGGSMPVVREHDLSRPGGLGMHLVSSFARTWGVDELPDGKNVWCKMNPAPAAS